MNLQHFWRCSLNTANLRACSLAAGPLKLTQAFTPALGLLHGLGELVMHLADPERAQSLNTLVSPLDIRRWR